MTPLKYSKIVSSDLISNYPTQPNNKQQMNY